MPYEVDVGGGEVVVIEEPRREDFEDNLRGALEFWFIKTIYNVFGYFSDLFQKFISGITLTLFKRLEPDYLHYVGDIIDELLSMEDVPQEVKDFLTKIRNPEREAGGQLLEAMGQQIAGAIGGSLFSSLTRKIGYAVNYLTRNALAAPSDLLQMYFRGSIDEPTFWGAMGLHGFTDETISAYLDIAKRRADVGQWLEALARGNTDEATVMDELRKRGFAEDDIRFIMQNRYALLRTNEIFQAYFRGIIDESELEKRLKALGYNTPEQEILKRIFIPRPGPSDLVRFAIREAYNAEVVQRWAYDEDMPIEFLEDMKALGYSEEDAKKYWFAHWELPSTTQGFEMLQRGLISEEELDTLLKLQDYPRFWRERLKEIRYHVPTRVDIRRMYRLGIYDEAKVKEMYMKAGYSEEDAEALTRFTIEYETEDPSNKLEVYQRQMKELVIDAYQKRLITENGARDYLSRLGYKEDEINILINVAEFENEVRNIPYDYIDYRKDIVGIIATNYKKRLLLRDMAENALRQVGIPESEIEYLLNMVDYDNDSEALEKSLASIKERYITQTIERGDAIAELGRLNITGEMQEQLLREWTLERETRTRHLTEAQYRKAYNMGLITVEEYRDHLKKLGYTDEDIEILVKMLTA